MTLFQSIKSYFTLKFIEYRFTDSVSGKRVNLYQDCYGNKFLKDSRWSLFSVPVIEAEYTHNPLEAQDNTGYVKEASDNLAKAMDSMVLEALSNRGLEGK